MNIFDRLTFKYCEEAGEEGSDPGAGNGGDSGVMGGDSPAAEPSGDQGGQQGDVSWRDSIQDESLQKFVGNFNTLEDMAKNALHYRQKLSNAVSLPGKDASDEEVKEFYSKLGVPESAEGYEINYPDEESLPETLTKEGLEPIYSAFLDPLHKAGATQNVVSAVMETITNVLKGSHEDAIAAHAKQIKDGEDALRKEWGGEYELNNNYAQRAYKQFGNEEFQSLMDSEVGGIKLSNNPTMMKVFADIGRKMGEGGLQYVATEADQQTFEQEQDRLTQEAHKAQDRGDRIAAERLFKERDEAAQRYYGQ